MSAQRMPVLFVGHGSPMNALEDNSYTQHLKQLGQTLPRPESILVVSAHWETMGTRVLSHDSPRTIYDFYGFPKALSQIVYPVSGSAKLSKRVAELLKDSQLDSSWGLDHGAWAVLHHMYPKADIPVIQLSLNQKFNFAQHYQCAQSLKPLRQEGVLILGSGNLVHNLRTVDFKPNPKPEEWAVEFDQMLSRALLRRDLKTLLTPEEKDLDKWEQAIATAEHYLPMLYVLGASEDDEKPEFPYEEIQAGTISMRSVLYQ